MFSFWSWNKEPMKSFTNIHLTNIYYTFVMTDALLAIKENVVNKNR